MSHYAVVRMAKFTHSQLGGVLSHDFREKENYGSNPDIDQNRSKDNVFITDKGGLGARDIIHEIDKVTSKTTGRVNARSVRLNEFIITSDKNFFRGLTKEKQNEFFKDSFNFFLKRYGENLQYGCIHYDEKTPHMHLGLVPITKDNQLNSKKIFTPTELRSLQQDFVDQVGSKYGLEKGDGKGKKHVDTKQFKRLTEYASMQRRNKAFGEFINKMYKNPKSRKGLIEEVFNQKNILKGSVLEIALNNSGCYGAIQKDPYWQELEKEELEHEQEEENEIEL